MTQMDEIVCQAAGNLQHCGSTERFHPASLRLPEGDDTVAVPIAKRVTGLT